MAPGIPKIPCIPRSKPFWRRNIIDSSTGPGCVWKLGIPWYTSHLWPVEKGKWSRDHGILRFSLLFQVPKPPVELRCHNGRPCKKTRFLPTNMAFFTVGNSNAFGFFKHGNGKSTIYWRFSQKTASIYTGFPGAKSTGESWFPKKRLPFGHMLLGEIHIWLVVWNIFYFSIHWECHHPNWISYFSDG